MAKHTDPDRDTRLLEELDEDTLRMLFPERFRDPATVTFVFEPLDGRAAAEADELAAAGTITLRPDPDRPGAPQVHEVTFGLDAIEAAHGLFELLDRHREPREVDVLICGRELPGARELWLPLLWGLRD